MSVINHLRTLGVYLSGAPDNRMGINGHFRFKNTITTLDTASALTLTVAQILSGFILRDPNGAARTDTTPTATAIINALGIGAVVGSAFNLTIQNTGTIKEFLTIAGGAGVTLVPTAIVIDANESLTLRFIITSVTSPAVTIYNLGITNPNLADNTEIVTADRAIVPADNGKIFLIGTDTKVFTLPATIKGHVNTFVNIGAAGNNIITIASAVADYIAGTLTLAATVVVKGTTTNKDLINTKTTSQVGDFARLVGDGIGGWYIIGSAGIWASE